MKRSEMLNYITERIYQCIEEVEKHPDIECEIKNQFGEIILDDILKYGMLPPSIPSGEFTGHISSMYTNQWEPEDEDINL